MYTQYESRKHYTHAILVKETKHKQYHSRNVTKRTSPGNMQAIPVKKSAHTIPGKETVQNAHVIYAKESRHRNTSPGK